MRRCEDGDRSALIERTRLSVRRQTQQKPVYALVRARRDGSLGPRIRPAQYDCDALREQAVAAARTGGPSPYPQTAPDQIACGMRWLGLKLEFTTGPVEMLIVEHIECPTPD